MAKLKVMVVDDTIVYRKIITDVLNEIPQVEVVGSASNGKIALARMKVLKPDLVTLDVEMPEMNGIEVLEAVRELGLDVGVIMLSSLTTKGGDLTMRALELGAFDFITKPMDGSMEENKALIRQSLTPLLRAFATSREVSGILRGRLSVPALKPRTPGLAPRQTAPPVIQKLSKVDLSLFKAEIIALGISTGGPNALATMMPALPANLKVPMVIVQHMPPKFTQSLANSLNNKCAFPVVEARNGMLLEAGTAYIAPGGQQMKIALGADASHKIIRITDDPPENNCKPSADYLFRSVSQHYLGRALGVIMTGMGSDGTLGLRLMKRNGCMVIAQDEATCVVYGMPREAVNAGVVDLVVPLNGIAAEIVKAIK